MKGRYMAYVGSYSYTGKAKGITVYDIDVEKGIFIPRCEEEVNNSSYVIASSDTKTLYSIADEGVVSFRIHENGSITRLNSAGIKGMRGCHLSTDAKDKYLFVSGYHDGKSTVLRLHEDGSIGEIVDHVFHKGLGSVAERNFRPHVSCSRRTPDGKYVMVSDLGIDQVKIYRFNECDEKLVLVDALRCERESAPKCFRFSSDGKFFYLLYELKNVIEVYTYETGERNPKIEKIQTISTTGPKRLSQLTAACSMRFSSDEKYLFCGNAGDNTVSVYRRDTENGLLELICCLPISGDYPKDIAVFPDDQHIASINHENGSITFFHVDYEKGLLVMSGKSVRVNEPNSCVIVKVN
ncbi:beta-propeller fold lactonase family protein [Clostridium sp. AM58-1XD]|uniref:lactonase family protein n=1 Tax=Clostridium sp. AM58-1XD TaxID=2292307 RepID=UPI000E4E13F2|nr:beta-propeller fold lactonase family protein [Clostridium sp. AM58-1XD]RGY96288.1 lactonase family protein [Clostridium sp. AM58-1XD]